MNDAKISTYGFIFLLLLAAIACTVPGLSGTPTPSAPPTPLGDTLTYFVPVYSQNLNPGDTVPGTRLQYVARNGDAYDVLIDGLAATKRIGDSFFWKGIIAPGVQADYKLRLTTEILGQLPVAGTVDITVFNPTPIKQDSIAAFATAPLQFKTIALTYNVPPGRQVPGTTLIYEGVFTEGEDQFAEFSGSDGYPYFAAADSLVWEGLLRDNVAIHYDLRIVTISADAVNLVGTANIWITTP